MANKDGHGYRSGYGNGDGSGSGDGYVYGDGNGDGFGNGDGSGYGTGNGYGSGYGTGNGDGDWLKCFNIPEHLTYLFGEESRLTIPQQIVAAYDLHTCEKEELDTLEQFLEMQWVGV